MITPFNLEAIFVSSHSHRFYSDWASLLTGNLPLYGIKTEMRQAAFIAQCAHESQEFTRLSENLNYSSAGLLRTFRKYFNETTALSYAGKPEMIGNLVYANRMGNGGPETGEGYKYRGRGLIHVTGKESYRRVGERLNLDLIKYPELLEQPLSALRSACVYWVDHDLNGLADIGDIERITRIINGGYNGIEDRRFYYQMALSALMAN